MNIAELNLTELKEEELAETEGGLIVMAIGLGLAAGAALAGGFAIGWAMYEHN